MALMVVGLVCLSFMRFAWTEKKDGRETLERGTHFVRGISSVESDIGQFLFQVMDQQIARDNMVTLPEYFKSWSSADINYDKYLSTQEVNSFLEKHLLEPSSNAARIFGETDLKNTSRLTMSFRIFDTNKDNILRSAEFYSAYIAWTQEILGSVTSTESFQGISSEDEEIGLFLFQVMDREINVDKKVTLPEYFQFWSRADGNKDKHLSTQEVNKFLEDHLLGPSSYAERIFGETDLTNALSLIIPFKIFDTNKDDVIRSDEFYTAFTTRFNTPLVL